MKVGIETALALAAAGLLTTGQKVAADEQDLHSQLMVTEVGNQPATTTTEAVTDSDSTTSDVTAPKATASESAATTTDAPAPLQDAAKLSLNPDESAPNENQSSTSDDTSNTESSVPTDPTIQQQLQNVVSTQLQADASAQVAAQKQSELDATQQQYDQHQQALDTQAQAYTQAVDTYAAEKDDFEVAQARTQQLVQAHNEQTAQYQLEADAYNAAQQVGEQATLAIQIAQYNASKSTYQQGLTTFAAEQAKYKQDLTSYQQAVSTYDPEKATDADFSSLQTRYQQLKTTQLRLQSTAAAIEASQTQFANLYAQLQKAVQKDVTAFDATKYEQLNAQRQALLTEAKELISRQASPDQNAARAQALLATYDHLNEQRDQLQIVDAQLTQEEELLYDATEKLNDAQDRAYADQDAADEAKEYAQDHISSAMHSFIASLGSNQGNNTLAVQASHTGNPAHTKTAMAAHSHPTFTKPATLQVLTGNVEIPMQLVAAVPETADLPTFAAPQSITADELLTAAILLPEAPTTPTKTTVATPVTRAVNVLDADTGAVVFAITINADDVALTLPAGYQLASRQINHVYADASTVTVQSDAGNAVVYVQKDADVQTQIHQTDSPQSTTGTQTPQTHDEGDSVIAADHRQKVTKVGPALSVNASDYYDNRTPQATEVTKSAPAISVSASEYYDHRGTIIKVGPGLSVSVSEYYDNRPSEKAEVIQTSPTVNIGASDVDDDSEIITKVGPALSVSASEYYDNRAPEKAEVTKSESAVSVGASDDDDDSETITKVGPALSVSAADYYDHRQVAKIADSDTTAIDKGAKSSMVSAAEPQTQNHSQQLPIKLSTSRIINQAVQSSSTQADVHIAKVTTQRSQIRYPRTAERQTRILTTLGIGLLAAMMGVSEIRRRSR